jgi:hypothetical protein
MAGKKAGRLQVLICPGGGSKVRKALDGKIGESGKDGGQIVADRKLDPPTAFHNRKNRRNLRASLLASHVDPVLAIMYRCT